MDIPGGLQLILGLIVLISSAGSAVSFFRVSMAKETITSLRGDRDDFKERVDRLHLQNEDLVRQITAQGLRIDSLIDENKRLQNYMSGTDAITAFAATAKAMDGERKAEHHDISCLIMSIQAMADANHKEMMVILREFLGRVGSA